MRIIGGRFRGHALAAVGAGDPGAHLRPTTDRVRENIFNLIQQGRYGVDVEEARVLDLFCGSGALGLEALSRGAAQVTFVDNGAAARKLLQRNIELLRVGEACRLVRRDAARLGAWDGPGHDLVFLDPPYGRGLGERALAAALAGAWIAPRALVVAEDNTALRPVGGLAPVDTRRYGDTTISILVRGPS